MKRIQVRYQRRRDVCRECACPIDAEPNHGGVLYGWEPDCGTCFNCWCVGLFGDVADPDEEWWRRARKLVKAAWRVSDHIAGNGPLLDF